MVEQIITGPALTELQKLPAESVDCVVTSPPYWGLRDYDAPGQLGQEPTFVQYVEDLCAIFDEVKRVLKPSGTCWVNIGDTYGGRVGGAQGKNGQFAGRAVAAVRLKHERPLAKCLLQIPSRFAIAMIDRGWILRNEIIWHKPNCMPASVKDRFTVDFEKVFFFTKSQQYYFEQQREIAKNPEDDVRRIVKAKGYNRREQGGNSTFNSPAPHSADILARLQAGRNKRTVWSVATQPFNEAHFAVYPKALVVPMIKAGCPEGGVVLDPFFGSGTTGLAARAAGRGYIGIDINPDYIKLASKRLANTVLTF